MADPLDNAGPTGPTENAGPDVVGIRPGPVLCVWRGGQEVARVPLDLPAALALLEALAREARAAAATPTNPKEESP